jgi:hypothetical protein
VSARRPAGAAAAAGLAAVLAAPVAAADGDRPGSYCPLPRDGETPRCLARAQAEYGEFFSALGARELDAASLARVERDLEAGGGSEKAWLALSSLAWGYWQLSLRAAGREAEHPEIAERLAHWNALLGRAYAESAQPEGFRAAIRTAAHDLQRQAPPVRVACLDERGDTSECSSTDAVLRGLDAAADDAGIRGGIRRLLERWLGGRAEP